MKKAKLGYAIPQLPTGNIQTTAEFFEKNLGFEILGIYEKEKYLLTKRGAAEIHFWQTHTEEEAKELGKVSSCYVRVEGIETLYEDLKKRGVKFRYELTEQPWKMKEMQIDDPYGNAIRFGEDIS